jgi:DNA-binding transcriptional LysR family regulator
LPADLAYYVAYLADALKRPKVRAFRDWLFEEAKNTTL